MRRGDNLWRVAARRVAAETGRSLATLGEDEVRTYWVRLVRANEGRLASGDPNLVYPSEELVLPALFEHR